ncbi:hypothetical protein HYFRA_00000538 [Hymenoscyphus fraxineus]|uniref:Uncharacterized protein n=1 Tax=Hymenoscyphus fraxineus TaxID=746836 RepID=A0A9N9L409_9HELO|nr:hypothetical protein HYFRA_00000538 [Hymenoscyphus fraxineus]
MGRGSVKLDKECVEAIAELKEWQPDLQACESLKRQRIDGGVELAVTAEQQNSREDRGESEEKPVGLQRGSEMGLAGDWLLAVAVVPIGR